MVDDIQKHQTIFPSSNPWQSAEGYNLPTNVEKEFNKFQVRANEPVARDLENYVFDYRNKQGLYPMNIDSVPIMGGGWKVSDRNLRKIQPNINAGIPATNQGYKVMNAGLFDDPTADGGWIDRLSRWWYGDDDPENDFQENPPYDPDNPNHFMVPEENPPYDPDNPNHFMVPEGMDPELFEPGIETLQAGMNDSLQSLQYDIDQLDPDSPNYDDMLELLNSDIDMKYPWAQMAGLTQTWQDIVDRTGSEDLANQWLATQQANRGGIIGLI